MSHSLSFSLHGKITHFIFDCQEREYESSNRTVFLCIINTIHTEKSTARSTVLFVIIGLVVQIQVINSSKLDRGSFLVNIRPHSLDRLDVIDDLEILQRYDEALGENPSLIRYAV